MLNILHIEKLFERVLAPLLPLPWWWVVPAVLGALGATSAGAAAVPALRAL